MTNRHELLAAATNVPSTRREPSPATPAGTPEDGHRIWRIRRLPDGRRVVGRPSLEWVSADADGGHRSGARRGRPGAPPAQGSPSAPREKSARRDARSIRGPSFSASSTRPSAERRMRGVTLTVDRSRAEGPLFAGDEDLLVAAIGALVVAAPALLSAQRPSRRVAQRDDEAGRSHRLHGRS